MRRTPGMKKGDARVKNGILTPGGVERRRNDGVRKERVKHTDDKRTIIVGIKGG